MPQKFKWMSINESLERDCSEATPTEGLMFGVEQFVTLSSTFSSIICSLLVSFLSCVFSVANDQYCRERSPILVINQLNLSVSKQVNDSKSLD